MSLRRGKFLSFAADGLWRIFEKRFETKDKRLNERININAKDT
jgi:hypothetical protein